MLQGAVRLARRRTRRLRGPIASTTAREHSKTLRSPPLRRRGGGPDTPRRRRPRENHPRGGWIFRARMPGQISQQWTAKRVLSRSSAARRSCRSNSTSDGVSIRGVFEVASFRPGKAIDAEPEVLPPPLFELCAMFRSQCPYLASSGASFAEYGFPVNTVAPRISPPCPRMNPARLASRVKPSAPVCPTEFNCTAAS